MTQRKTDTKPPASTSASNSRRPMDPEVPARYLRENFEPADRLAMVLIQKETHRVIQRVAAAEKIAEPEFQAWLRHANARKFEVYVGMNPVKADCRTRTKESIAAIRHVYLDFDENGTAAVQDLLKRDDIPEPQLSPEHLTGKMAGDLEGGGIRAGGGRALAKVPRPRDRRRSGGHGFEPRPSPAWLHEPQVRQAVPCPGRIPRHRYLPVRTFPVASIGRKKRTRDEG